MSSSSKGPRRTRSSGGERTIDPGRELALLVLCHLDAHPPQERAQAAELLWEWAQSAPEERAASPNPLAPGQEEPELSAGGQLARLYAQPKAREGGQRWVKAWIEDLEQVDALIEEVSQRWRLARMEVTDRNVIRLATLELQDPSVSKPAIVADAVRLASRYGAERSARFVNGLVESIAKKIRGVDEA